MKTEHTPGPWKAVEMGVIADVLTSHGNFYVCSLINAENPEDKANARLIAAAPEMLEALRRAIVFCEDITQHRPTVNPMASIRAAIAKAEAV